MLLSHSSLSHIETTNSSHTLNQLNTHSTKSSHSLNITVHIFRVACLIMIQTDCACNDHFNNSSAQNPTRTRRVESEKTMRGERGEKANKQTQNKSKQASKPKCNVNKHYQHQDDASATVWRGAMLLEVGLNRRNLLLRVLDLLGGGCGASSVLFDTPPAPQSVPSEVTTFSTLLLVRLGCFFARNRATPTSAIACKQTTIRIMSEDKHKAEITSTQQYKMVSTCSTPQMKQQPSEGRKPTTAKQPHTHTHTTTHQS